MRIGYKPSHDSEDGHGIYFHVRMVRCDVILIERHQTIVLLVHVNVLDHAAGNEGLQILVAMTAAQATDVIGGELK